MNSTCCAARNVYCNISCVCVRQGVKWAYSWYGNMVVKFRKKMFRAGGREPKKTKEEKKKEKEALKLEALGGGKRKREEDHEEDEVTEVEGPKKKGKKSKKKMLRAMLSAMMGSSTETESDGSDAAVSKPSRSAGVKSAQVDG